MFDRIRKIVSSRPSIRNSVIRNSVINQQRRGSALLIVLGMVSFMVVSAVSFAMFMRQSRAPSSYLRRSSTARYLLKAALANAISRIDGQFASDLQIWGTDSDSLTSGQCEGIYDDPYPGVGPVQGSAGDDNGGRNRNGDLWVKRVFCPFGSIPPNETVATLNLEALAYLPPAVINEVRLYSRQTRTARWHNLAYDAGRYAFCAVDVSDCFDINKVLANERRTSAPNQRVNLSSLYSGNYGAQLDQILTQWDSSDIPFVSVADFNVTAENSPFAPFYRYIGTSGEAIYNPSDWQTVSNALFITDTWFPPTNTVGTTSVRRFSLTGGGSGQPFSAFKEDAVLRDAVTAVGNTSLGTEILRRIGYVGIGCLYDYLDADSVPLSLCIPCVESVPMVSALSIIPGNFIKPQVEKVSELKGTYPSGKTDPETGEAILYTRTATKYAVTSFGDKFQLAGTVMVPFRRLADKGYSTSGFKAEALVRLWWGLEPCDSRLAEDAEEITSLKKDDWQDKVAGNVITIKKDVNLNMSVKDEPEEQKKAFFDFSEIVTIPSARALNLPMLWAVEEVDENGKSLATYCSLDGIKDDKNAMVPRKTDGRVDAWWEAIGKVGPDPATLCKGGKWQGTFTHNVSGKSLNTADYVMHMAVWLKITDPEGKTVDLVPAKIADDEEFGAGAHGLPKSLETNFGTGAPILEFRGTDCVLRYDRDHLDKGLASQNPPPETFSKSWDALYCADPRFNWAPENWFGVKNSDEERGRGEDWLKKMTEGSSPFALDDRDPDIYIFASDQEYLQSMGELQFLPFCGWLPGGGDVITLFANQLTHGGFGGSQMSGRNKWNDCACSEIAWKGYSPFDYDIYGLNGAADVSTGSNDFRANPFSPDPRVMDAVVRYTPYDYYVASTNDAVENKFVNMSVQASRSATFGKDGAVAVMEDDVIDEIGANLRAEFEAYARSGGTDWRTKFNDLAWFDGNNTGDNQLEFLGVELDNPLYGVDRKFLYSFWRECFQNRQQLFLVFIRAEPLTVGGMGENSLANAQLGARGVALVWRDPAPPSRGGNRPGRTGLTGAGSFYNSDDFAPHRTRVLFYHQFD